MAEGTPKKGTKAKTTRRKADAPLPPVPLAPVPDSTAILANAISEHTKALQEFNALTRSGVNWNKLGAIAGIVSVIVTTVGVVWAMAHTTSDKKGEPIKTGPPIVRPVTQVPTSTSSSSHTRTK